MASMTAEQVVAAIQARGSDATDLRDAVHEAHHAVVTKLKRPWERERIHQALLRMPRVRKWGLSMLVMEEIDARAVERLACERFGVPYDAERWAMAAAMETCKTFGVGMQLDWWTARIEERAKSARASLLLDSLLRKLARKTKP